jgi:hypothetical protein
MVSPRLENQKAGEFLHRTRYKWKNEVKKIRQIFKEEQEGLE